MVKKSGAFFPYYSSNIFCCFKKKRRIITSEDYYFSWGTSKLLPKTAAMPQVLHLFRRSHLFLSNSSVLKTSSVSLKLICFEHFIWFSQTHQFPNFDLFLWSSSVHENLIYFENLSCFLVLKDGKLLTFTNFSLVLKSKKILTHLLH